MRTRLIHYLGQNNHTKNVLSNIYILHMYLEQFENHLLLKSCYCVIFQLICLNMFKKVLELTNIYQYFFPLTGTLLRNLVLELGVRVIYPEIVPYMKTWNLNWPVCIKRSEPQSLLVVMWPMTLPCSPWPNICLVTGFFFFFLNILMHDGVGPLLYLHLIILFYYYIPYKFYARFSYMLVKD